MPGSRDGLLKNLDLANAKRDELYRNRAKVISEVTMGRRTILEAMTDPSVRRMRAYTFLTKLPRIGRRTSRDILREVNVGETQRLSTTGARQRERIAELALEARPRGRR